MNEFTRQIEDRGWALVDLPRPGVVEAIARYLRAQTYPHPGPLYRLEEYGERDDDRHEALQFRLTEDLQAFGSLDRLIRMQAPLLDRIVGPDFLIQARPHLRIARPGVDRDNVGYHRDTDYGAQPEELSVWVPFVDLPAEGSLEVLDGSHKREFAVFQAEEGSTGVTKGSLRHRLGFPYAPKLLVLNDDELIHGVPVKVGQALVFSLALVHGTVCNRSAVARWSADIRVAPASFAPRARPGYYLEVAAV